MNKIIGYKKAVDLLSTGNYYISFWTMPFDRTGGNIQLLNYDEQFCNYILRSDTFYKLLHNGVIFRSFISYSDEYYDFFDKSSE